MFRNLKVARLAYRFYFKRAPLPTRIFCAGRLLKNRFFRARAPISVMIAVTYRCQCRCVHCGMAAYAVNYSDELMPKISSVCWTGFTRWEPLKLTSSAGNHYSFPGWRN